MTVEDTPLGSDSIEALSGGAAVRCQDGYLFQAGDALSARR